MKKIIPAILTFTLLASQPDIAQAQDIGTTLKGFIDDIGNPFLMLIFFCSGVGGLFLFIRGFFKLAEASQDRGGGGGYGSGVAYILAAAILIALPDAGGMGMQSLLGDARGGGTLGSGGLDFNDSRSDSGTFLDQIMTATNDSIMTPNNCLAVPDPAVCVAENIAKNIVPMAIYVLFALTFLLGFIGFAATVFKIVQSNDRRESTGGHVGRLVLCALLMNSPFLLELVNSTIGVSDSSVTVGGLSSGSSMLTYSIGGTNAALARVSQLITHFLWILAFFGAWAFIRGIAMMKSVSEQGSQGGSYAMAGVYIMGGVLMVNMKFSICMVGTTIGYNTGAGWAGFCSASDKRLKKNLRRIGELPHLALGLYSWEYIDHPNERFVGVLAQEVLENSATRHAVFTYLNGSRKGYYGVNYASLGIRCIPENEFDGDINSLTIEALAA